jgi:putative DNA primase/helicase
MDLYNAAVELQPDVAGITEIKLADRFAAEHEGHLRYVSEWGTWMHYEGGRWKREKTLRAFDLARKICKAAAEECSRPSDRKTLMSAKTITAVEKIAKADRRLAATVEQWDSDLWLLNTPNGTVELKTGTMRAHNPLDYITKMTKVAPGGRCLQWLTHLGRIFNHDKDLISFHQRFFGSCLTGDTSEQQFLFAYGEGQNGKGTTINTAGYVLGDYHYAAPIDLFLASTMDRHPTELASLCGARFVTSHEPEEGRRWNEARLKQLTGGDPVTARFMRQDPFTFKPQLKLYLSGNHKPRLTSANKAIERRLNLIHFNVTISDEQRDNKLDKKLETEAGGILQWMIDGCLAWQKDKLTPPQSVRQATVEYVECEDVIRAWFEENYVRSNGFVSTRELFSNWKYHCEKTGEFMGTERKFSEWLNERSGKLGIRKGMGLDHSTRGFWGLRFQASVQR